jgi:hypothetical protein
MVKTELPALKVILEPQVLKAHKVQQARRDLPVLMEQLVLPAHKVLKAHKVMLV